MFFFTVCPGEYVLGPFVTFFNSLVCTCIETVHKGVLSASLYGYAYIKVFNTFTYILKEASKGLFIKFLNQFE